MTRDLDQLVGRRFDVLVIGGGIHGIFAAYDAASRGLSVALVEQDDFGAGLSFQHQRTLHGGLRALQSGQIGKCRRQVAERRAWARMAPHLVRPLPFLIGTYRFSMRSRTMLRAGFRAYEMLSRSRNRGVLPELHLPKARLESAAATKKLFPGVAEAGLSGGAIWYDYQTKHPERLTWTATLAAAQAGAVCANHVEAIVPVLRGNAVAGARVRDRLTGREFEIEASQVLLAAGAGLGRLMEIFGVTGAPPLVRAMNVLVDRRARDIALAAPDASGQMLTAVPWRGGVLVGTSQSRTTVADEAAAPPDAVAELLAAGDHAFPRLEMRTASIRMLHHGLVPADVKGDKVDFLAEPKVIRHSQAGRPGVVSLIGVKYTTARWAAQQAVDAVAQELGRPRGTCRTGERPFPHGDVADVEGRLIETERDFGIEVSREDAEHLASWYGTEAPDVLRYSASVPGGLQRLSPDLPVLAGEISHAVRTSAALTLADAVLRRTALGSAGDPGGAALEQAAAIMGAELGWDEARRAEEVSAVRGFYPPR